MPPDPTQRDKLRAIPGDASESMPRVLPGVRSGHAPDSDFRPGHLPSEYRRSITIQLIAVAAALVAVAAWWWLRSEAGPADPWITATVGVGDVEDSVTALGNLQPKDYVDVGAQVSGQLTRIDVQVGAKVRAGDLLAEIDPTLLTAKVTADQAALAGLQAQLVDREAQLDLAIKQTGRQQNLMQDNATSQDALETAEAAARSDKAQVAALQAQAKQAQSTLAADQASQGYTRIYAPMSGTVVSLTARQGQTLNAAQQAPVILRIADLSTMTVWTQVSEADVPRLKLGMDAYFTTLGDQTDRWPGRLRQILPTPDVINNVVLFPALFDVANPSGSLMTQMSAQVFFVVASVKNAVTVPVAALRPPGQESSPNGAAQAETRRLDLAPGADSADVGAARPYLVRVLSPGGHIKRRQVWIGVMNRASAEVLAGLEPGDVVVIGRQPSGPDSGNGTDNRTGGAPRSGIRSLF